MIEVDGLRYHVTSKFEDNEQGISSANKYMQSHPDETVLTIKDGEIILTKANDLGIASTNTLSATKKWLKNLAVYPEENEINFRQKTG